MMPRRTNSGLLLILDDDPMIAEAIASMAERLNFDTLITLNPADFFQKLKNLKPTHAIIDLSMPEMDGLQVMKLIDARCPARIIIASATGNRILEAARRVGLAHGLDILGILRKPFSLGALKDLLSVPQVTHPTKADIAAPGILNRRSFTRSELSDGLNQDEFTIYLQPKVRCIDDRIIGFEALARWNHPVHGVLMPSDFALLFEEYELEAIWMEKLIRLAANYMKSLSPANVHLSLNMSMSGRSKATTPQLLSTLKRELGGASEKLIIEVVENGLVDATSEDIEMFVHLRLGGFQLSIDDFGLGFSSFARLVRIPFSELKIDRSFVKEARISHEAREVIRSIVTIGHSLEMSVTAEGVEDAETLKIVKELGCDNVQGFVYSRPVPLEQVLPWINAGGHLPPVAKDCGVHRREA